MKKAAYILHQCWHIFVSTLIVCCFTLNINDIKAQELDSGAVVLRAETHTFFKDNEYDHSQYSGYTLPGFVFSPKILWQVNSHVNLDVGVHWLNFWGTISYPQYNNFQALPIYSDTSSRLHIRPILSASIDCGKGVSLTLGTLNRKNREYLPRPLYNEELVYTADPEAGAQINITRTYYDAEVWVDWKNFIFNKSPYQERFTLGVMAKPHHNIGNLYGYLPLHLLVQHVGGERVVSENHRVITYYNAAEGLGLAYKTEDKSLALESYIMQYGVSDTVELPLKSGLSMYETLKMNYKRIALDISFYHGDNFIPLLGEEIYSSFIRDKNKIATSKTNIISAKIGYVYEKYHFASLSLEGTIHYLFQRKTVDEFGTFWTDDAAMIFNFGLFIHLNPTITLHK